MKQIIAIFGIGALIMGAVSNVQAKEINTELPEERLNELSERGKEADSVEEQIEVIQELMEILKEFAPALEDNGASERKVAPMQTVDEPTGDRPTLSIAHEQGEMAVSWQSEPGEMYKLQSSRTLSDWETVIVLPGDGKRKTYLVSSDGSVKKRFYRLVVQ